MARQRAQVMHCTVSTYGGSTLALADSDLAERERERERARRIIGPTEHVGVVMDAASIQHHSLRPTDRLVSARNESLDQIRRRTRRRRRRRPLLLTHLQPKSFFKWPKMRAQTYKTIHSSLAYVCLRLFRRFLQRVCCVCVSLRCFYLRTHLKGKKSNRLCIGRQKEMNLNHMHSAPTERQTNFAIDQLRRRREQ